jgi:hypothetical protein
MAIGVCERVNELLSAMLESLSAVAVARFLSGSICLDSRVNNS